MTTALQADVHERAAGDQPGSPSPTDRSSAPGGDARDGDGASGFADLLTDRVFGPFFFANSLSNIGNWFQNIAAGIVVFELTGSSTAVGVASIVQFLATMLLTPVDGRADRPIPLSERIRTAVGRSRVIPLGLGLTAAGLTTVALAPATAVALAGAMVAGSGFLLGVTGTNAELQKAMPEELRGRVMAWWSVAFLGCRPAAWFGRRGLTTEGG